MNIHFLGSIWLEFDGSKCTVSLKFRSLQIVLDQKKSLQILKRRKRPTNYNTCRR